MAKTVNFYSAKELNELKQIVASPKGSQRAKAILQFATKSKRSVHAVYAKINKMLKNSKTSKTVKDASLKTAPNSKKGEFIIPVKNWKLQHEDGNLNIVINF